MYIYIYIYYIFNSLILIDSFSFNVVLNITNYDVWSTKKDKIPHLGYVHNLWTRHKDHAAQGKVRL